MSTEEGNDFRVASEMTIKFGEGANAGHINYVAGAPIDFYVTESQDIAVETMAPNKDQVQVIITDSALAGKFLDNVLSVQEELTVQETATLPITSLIMSGKAVDDIAKAMVSEKMKVSVVDGQQCLEAVPVAKVRRRLNMGQRAKVAMSRKKTFQKEDVQSITAHSISIRTLAKESVDPDILVGALREDVDDQIDDLDGADTSVVATSDPSADDNNAAWVNNMDLSSS